MKILILLFLAVLPRFSMGQTYNSQVKDSTILDFMRWEIEHGEHYTTAKRRKISDKILTFDTLNFFFPDSLQPYGWKYDEYLFNRFNKIDTLFSKNEIELLFIQFTAVKDTVWSHQFRGAKFTHGRSPHNSYWYSVPLFSSDMNFVLIKKSFYCGNLCAYGGIYLYRKINDNE